MVGQQPGESELLVPDLLVVPVPCTVWPPPANPPTRSHPYNTVPAQPFSCPGKTLLYTHIVVYFVMRGEEKGGGGEV